MNKVFLTTMLLFSMRLTQAASQFKAMDPNHPLTSIGAFADYKGHSDFGGVLALVTYKPATNSPLISLTSGWVPLDFGGTSGRGLGGPSIALGSGLNMLPAARVGGLALLTAISAPDQFLNLKSDLVTMQSNSPDVTLFLGPHENWVFTSFNKFKLKSKLITTLYIGANFLF